MNKSKFHKLAAIFCILHIVFNFCLTTFLLLVSSTNYPGGEAITKLHLIDNSTSVSVHISNLVAQTGFTRYLQNNDWTYNKTENLKYDDETILNFNYLLVENNVKSSSELIFLENNFNPVDHIECFSHIGLQYKYYNPINIKTKPCVTILRRKLQNIKIEKDIDYESLRKLALENKKEFNNSKAMRRIIKEYLLSEKSKRIAKYKVKSTIEQETKFKELIEKISKMDLTEYCDFEKINIKDCVKNVIDIVE